MKIKSYKSRTASEALEMVRNDMGPSALIIQTRPIKLGGVLGLLGHEGVEMIAATDDQPSIRRAGPRPGRPTQGAPRRDSSLRHLYDRLVEQGVLPALARALVEEALCRYPSTPFATQFPNFADRLAATPASDDLISAVGAGVAKAVRIERARKPAHGPKVIALVGPTGVGKTTTIAKLATIATMRHGLPTGLVTIDTYRIGAVDQLKTYSEMLAAPMAVVHRPGQMREALGDFSDRAVVFVDTIGRSPRDRARVNALKPYFAHLPDAETHLVVSATAKYDDALLTARSFSTLPLSRLIFSKIDESSSFGSIYNLAAETKIPMSYLTVGQEVPEDLEVATPNRIAQLLLEGAAEPAAHLEATA
jgi:flagellar biosynthesis protein FlhF